jgi:hypothetical protein
VIDEALRATLERANVLATLGAGLQTTMPGG